MQKQCTTGKERRVKRWEHEAVIDACRLGWSMTRGRLSTEMSLHVLAYNLKRMMSIFRIEGPLEAIRA